MNTEQTLLSQVPDQLCISTMLKATPALEGSERFIYLEASNEGVDQQGEMVLAKALEESAEHYLKFGNIDLDHYTVLGARAGIANPQAYEIGRPVDVAIRNGKTFVKAQLYTGDGPLAQNANMVWESMTQLNPPKRWYPSVGGAVLAKSLEIDPQTKNKVAVVSKVRWTNIALSQTPVNQHLPAAGLAPMATFAKSFNGFVMAKALEASYGTDVASLTGGGALGVQSLDPTVASYFDFKNELAGSLLPESREDIIRTVDGMVAYAIKRYNLPRYTAEEWVDRFLRDLKSELNKRGSR